MNTRALIVLTLAVPAWLSAPARAQAPPRPVVRATGEAIVAARPDQAQIDVGVVSQAPTAQAAAAQNAKQLASALGELRKALGAGADIKTISYSLSPDYRYPREGGRPTITSYTARNIVQVKTGRLPEIGKIIDAATQSGANTIHGIHFTLQDEHAVRAQALRDAALKGRMQAEAIAAALGVKVLRVLSAEQGEPPTIRPLREMALAAAAPQAVPTPVEPGTIEIRATVTVTLEIAQ